jgi:hypothetical protein
VQLHRPAETKGGTLATKTKNAKDKQLETHMIVATNTKNAKDKQLETHTIVAFKPQAVRNTHKATIIWKQQESRLEHAKIGQASHLNGKQNPWRTSPGHTAEVDQRPAVLRLQAQDVGWLQVPVHPALGVQHLQPCSHMAQHLHTGLALQS